MRASPRISVLVERGPQVLLHQAMSSMSVTIGLGTAITLPLFNWFIQLKMAPCHSKTVLFSINPKCSWGLFRWFQEIDLVKRYLSRDLAGGGSTAVAVDASDMWKVTHDTWHLTRLGREEKILDSFEYFVLVLDTAHVERDRSYFVLEKYFKIDWFFLTCLAACLRNPEVFSWDTIV